MVQTADEIEASFQSLRTWKRAGERAIHKPLLVLFALGRVQRDEERLVPFGETEKPLKALLTQFGTTRGSQHPEYPFWRLQSDGIWEVPGGNLLQNRLSNTDPKITELRTASGGFTERVDRALRADGALLCRIAQTVLDAHFPESLHDAIVRASGLELSVQSTVGLERLPRDPKFRTEVLRAYGHKCALCGYHASVDGSVVGLEAAHVMWHCYNGPNTVENGLSLCPLHHRIFDLGLVTIKNSRVVVSARVTEGGSAELHLGRLHGSLLHGPVSGYPAVASDYAEWHENRVFKAPGRSAA
jgi:putative restriction endonuclease